MTILLVHQLVQLVRTWSSLVFPFVLFFLALILRDFQFIPFFIDQPY